MGLFRKKQPETGPPTVAIPDKPSDFGFFDDDDWVAFNVAVLEAARTLNLDVERLDPGAVVLRGGDGLGLMNIAQRCHGSERSEWNSLLVDHFRLGTAIRAEPIDDFDPADLRIRLVPDDYFGPPAAGDDDLIARPFAENVLAVPAFDASDRVVIATADLVTQVGLSIDEAFERAWSQTRERERTHEVTMMDVGGLNFHVLLDGNYYAASLIRYLPDLIGEVGPNGALVSIPCRGDIFAYPFEDDSAMSAVKALIPVTRQIYTEWPGSVSPHVYWWRDGTLEWLPVFVEDDQLTFEPPGEFLEMLSQLPPAR